MAALEIVRLPVLSDNYCYLLHEPEGDVTAVVDPPVVEPIQTALHERGWTLNWIVITHHHQDHTGGLRDLKAATGAQAVGPRAEAGKIAELDRLLDEGDTFKLGAETARVLSTPGHTAGHISYHFANSRALFCGDVLFALGCGRTFEGTPAQLHASIEKFAAMPDDTLVYCGHEYTASNARFALAVEPEHALLNERAKEIERLRAHDEPTVPTELGLERATNPFLRTGDPALRAALGMAEATDAEVFSELRGRKDRF